MIDYKGINIDKLNKAIAFLEHNVGQFTKVSVGKINAGQFIGAARFHRDAEILMIDLKYLQDVKQMLIELDHITEL